MKKNTLLKKAAHQHVMAAHSHVKAAKEAESMGDHDKAAGHRTSAAYDLESAHRKFNEPDPARDLMAGNMPPATASPPRKPRGGGKKGGALAPPMGIPSY